MKCSGLVLALLGSPLLFGCTGFVYTHITEPLTLDMHATPVVDGRSAGDVKTFRYYIEVKWDNNGIGEIAREHGFEEVYYADLETLRVLGIWVQHWVHVYGTRKASIPAN